MLVALATTGNAAAQERPPAAERSPAENKIACDAGNADACEELGRAYRDGDGVSPDAGLSATYYQRACDAGRAAACAEQARVMRDSGVKKLEAGAGLPELRACLLGRKASCRAVERDRPDLSSRAIAARATRACKGNDAAACLMLGHLLRHGIGAARDHRRAATQFRRACDIGLALGCLALARAYEDGRGVPKDAARAKVLIRHSCKLNPASCTRPRQ